jgi:hypothetical protein
MRTLLTLSACNSQASTAAWQYALHYPGRRHTDANVFRRLKQRLRETGGVTPMALVNAGRPRTVRTVANENAIIAAVDRELWRSSRDIARKLGLTQPKVLETLMTINCIHPLLAEQTSVSRRSPSTDAILFMATSTRCGWALFTQHSADRWSVFYVWGCVPTSTIVTSGHGIILMLFADVCVKSASASAFGLLPSGTLSWAPSCDLTGWLLNDIVIFWKLFYRGCLKMCL